MIEGTMRRALRYLGYEIHRMEPVAPSPQAPTEPPPVDPRWPLPRRSGGPSDEEIHEKFSKYTLWHYAYAFEGGISFPARHDDGDPFVDEPERPLQRFRHFMPYLLQAQNGSLQGKRILDIACNSGFWSIQCALLGAEVVGFDARPELIEQAHLLQSIVGVEHAEFRVLDFWEMNPQSLGGPFDIVLNLGILYHLPSPLEALRLTLAMARDVVLLDTSIHRSSASVIRLHWEEPTDIRMANTSGMVARPSKRAVDLMLRHLGVAEWFEIPMRTTDMPRSYLDDQRASWLIRT